MAPTGRYIFLYSASLAGARLARATGSRDQWGPVDAPAGAPCARSPRRLPRAQRFLGGKSWTAHLGFVCLNMVRPGNHASVWPVTKIIKQGGGWALTRDSSATASDLVPQLVD